MEPEFLRGHQNGFEGNCRAIKSRKGGLEEDRKGGPV